MKLQILNLSLILSTFLSFQAHAVSSINGQWQGKSYKFSFWSNDIDGSWGDLQYDLNFWSSDIDGILANEKLDVNFWSSDIDGFLPCGSFDINIWSRDLDGHVCNQKFDIDIPSGVSGKEMAFQMIVDEMMSYVPSPARAAIRIRINEERAKRGWMMK